MSKKVNWHLAACNAIEIDLRDYASMLEYEREHSIGKNYYRIDLLVVKKTQDTPIEKRIASHFRKVNLFEIKGIHDSTDIRSFYKTNSYLGLYIDSQWKQEKLCRKDVTLNFLCLRRPRNLFSYLKKEYNSTIAKTAPGIYDVDRGLFHTRFLVTQELTSEDGLYLRCLTEQLLASVKLQETRKQLFEDLLIHKREPLYRDYLKQILYANHTAKGDGKMPEYIEETGYEDVILEVLGPWIERRQKIAEQKIKEQTEEIAHQKDEITRKEDEIARKGEEIALQRDEIAHLKQLLLEHGIPLPMEESA